jgi:hypothetical protein
MASYSTTPASFSPRQIASRRPESVNAFELLEANHARIAMLFAEFDRMASRDNAIAKAGIAAQIFREIKVHMQAVEDMLRPAVLEAQGDADAAKRMLAQHAIVRRLVEQLETVPVTDARYDIKVMALGDYALRDVELAETAFFRRVREAEPDLKRMAAALASRRSELKPALAQ